MEKMYESRLALFNEVVLPNDEELSVEEKRASVSYTHLTLPTIYSV